MKRTRDLILAAIVACGLASGGCAGLRTPPPPAPLLELLGTLEDGTYTASNGAFTARIPYAANSPERRNPGVHDDVTETENERLNSVAFGPTGSDPAIYRIVLSTHLGQPSEQKPLGDRADLIMSSFMVLYDDEFGGVGEQMLRKELSVDGRDALYAVYRYAPADERLHSFYTVFYFVEISDRQLLNVMASRWSADSPWHPGSDKLVARQWQRFNDFAAGVEVPIL